MTAAVLEGDEYKMRSLRVDGCLNKPFAVDDLMRKVEQALGR
jgi:CheY-like chemotaxis protein